MISNSWPMTFCCLARKAGVPAEVADICHARIRIPMRPEVRSMNLATTAAIVLGEALRQTNSLP
jgi:tRNA (cytidine/uridine-2'-O-)-methyltransferase